ncbi:hypothetical protein Pint_18865 [Pistacia integerrima]|uniref:Uncharacterized protein n=1 Tax=Pistacia integerrima TaxID=434235 RepID=A0ACC0YUJ5_9ROSI|nr:hypothetical protein Pint_18865 [Pistacia integerrima]
MLLKLPRNHAKRLVSKLRKKLRGLLMLPRMLLASTNETSGGVIPQPYSSNSSP